MCAFALYLFPYVFFLLYLDQVIVGGVTDDFSLYGMRVGSAMSGDVNAFTSVTLEIIWQPTVPGKVESEFRVAFTDPSLEEVSDDHVFVSVREMLSKSTFVPFCFLMV